MYILIALIKIIVLFVRQTRQSNILQETILKITFWPVKQVSLYLLIFQFMLNKDFVPITPLYVNYSSEYIIAINTGVVT